MTIDQTNINIYKSLYQHKALTEKIIGFTDYALQYAVATYKAVCTEGVDFTMFDKVICGILQIDEVSGFGEIADILGLSVIHRPEEGKYIDFGEKEILEYAIKSLIDFNMIETDDIYYSRIRLTEIGKDYAKQGKKYLPEAKKTFILYYDLNDKNHQMAKNRYRKFTNERQLINFNAEEETYLNFRSDYDEQGEMYFHNRFDFAIDDEVFVKEIAKIQTPEIYNPEQLRNFTDLELRGTEVFQVNFKVVGLVSIKDNSVRFLVYDDKQNIIQPITDLIQDNSTIKNELIESLINRNRYEPSNISVKTNYQREYEAAIKTQQQEVEDLLSQKQGEKAVAKTKEAYLNSNIVEAPYFELNFRDFFSGDGTKMWFFFINFSKQSKFEIEAVAKNLNQNSRLFIILPTDISDDDEAFFSEISDKNMNIYFDIIDFEKLNTNLFLIEKGDYKKAISKEYFLLNYKKGSDLISFKINVYVKTNEWSAEISEIHKYAVALIAESYCEIVKETVEDKISNLMQNPASLTKFEIDDLEIYSGRLKEFINEKNVSQLINDFYKASKEKISGLKGLLEFKVQSELNEVEISINDEEANYSISELRAFEDKLQDLRNNLYDENSEIGFKIKSLEDFIKPKIQALSKLERKPTPKSQNQKSNSFKNKR